MLSLCTFYLSSNSSIVLAPKASSAHSFAQNLWMDHGNWLLRSIQLTNLYCIVFVFVLVVEINSVDIFVFVFVFVIVLVVEINSVDIFVSKH